MQLTLVRHGQVEGISNGMFRGRMDLALTELGLRQAAATAKRLRRDERPVALYASPQRRAQQTATIVGAELGLAVQTLEEYCDIDYGAWQGHTAAELPADRDELAIWHAAPQFAVIPGGESLADVAARASRVVGTLLRRHAGDAVTLVGHDSINRVAILQALDLPLSRYWTIGQEPCAISVVDYGTYPKLGACSLRLLNEVEHLREL